MLKFYPTYMQDEKRFAKALFIKKYPSSLSDRFLTELATVPAQFFLRVCLDDDGHCHIEEPLVILPHVIHDLFDLLFLRPLPCGTHAL